MHTVLISIIPIYWISLSFASPLNDSLKFYSSDEWLGRIVGGTNAKRGEFPWIVRVNIDNKLVCGGTLISPEWIVTAGHCVIVSADRYSIVAGDYHQSKPDEGEQFSGVSQIIRHPNFQFAERTLSNDIALMRLSSPVTFSQYVRPASLPKMDIGPVLGSFDIAGWGLTSTENTAPPNVLQRTTVTLVPKPKCRLLYGLLAGLELDPNEFCAAQIGRDSCSGDSGGPLTSGNVLYGITSRGIGCGMITFPGLYTNVYSFVPWINSAMTTTTEDSSDSNSTIISY